MVKRTVLYCIVLCCIMLRHRHAHNCR